VVAGPATPDAWLRILPADGGSAADRMDTAFAIVDGPAPPPPPPPPGPLPAAASARINFQPRTIVVPAGYTIDAGDTFDAVRGFGWTPRVTVEARGTSVDVRLDTYAYVTNPASATWQMAVPNGSYRLTFVVGDPSFSGVHRVEVEGVRVVNDVVTTASFYTVTGWPVDVADGFLTIQLGGITGNTKKSKLCYLDLDPAGSTSPPPPPPPPPAANQPPVVTISVAPRTGTAPLVVAASASATDPENQTITYRWRFGDGGMASTAQAQHNYAQAGTYWAVVRATDPAGAADVESLSVSVSAPQSPPTATAALKIDFKPALAALAAGYTADTGATFDAVRTFGWDRSVPTDVRNRNSDLRLDTFAYVTNPAVRTWDAALPNGSYLVSLTLGDPAGTGRHRLLLQGTVILADALTINNQFITLTDLPVTVTDGRLHMQIGGIAGTAKKTKVCYIDVRPASAPVAKLEAPAARTAWQVELRPNPARHSVGYALTLPVSTHVTVQIFDVRGRLLRTLHDGPAPGGTFNVRWDRRDESGREVESGIYFVQTRAAGRVQTDKLSLVR